MQVREDAVELFGMSDEEELKYFRLLISVSGVGPKAAMSILTSMTPHALAVAIVSEDSKALSKAPGIGGKTAARIVLELHDKMAKELGGAAAPSVSSKASPSSGGAVSGGNLSDARDALTVLGYSRSEIMSALAKTDQSLSTEELIKAALALLMKQ
jgi:Holliday junction DNA helicase RuvA